MSPNPTADRDGLLEQVASRAAEVTDDVVRWRRHLHEHPELSYQETETSRFIREQLERIGGLEISSPTPTSVVADLSGGRSGPRVALRSDHDALPIEERTGLPFASSVPGVMHACGHDGHTAIMLGVATVLSGVAEQLPGNVRFLFEHGEEALPGGASQMVAAGAMDGVDLVLGEHLWAWIPTGQMTIRSGRLMAACDVFEITVRGRGGHISKPQDAVDPIAVGSQIVANLQHIVAREIDPQEIAVVGVTGFEAGHSVGVIPETARLEGGTNIFSAEVRDHLERRIGEIAEGICAAHGASCEYTYTRGYDAVHNDAGPTEIVARAAERAFGEEAVSEGEPILAGEDFSAFQASAPGTFVLLGARDEDRGTVHDHHHPEFDIDEEALPVGVELMSKATIALLEESTPTPA